MTPRILDLFCGAGGCSMGYYDAGFDVVGVYCTCGETGMVEIQSYLSGRMVWTQCPVCEGQS